MNFNRERLEKAYKNVRVSLVLTALLTVACGEQTPLINCSTPLKGASFELPDNKTLFVKDFVVTSFGTADLVYEIDDMSFRLNTGNRMEKGNVRGWDFKINGRSIIALDSGKTIDQKCINNIPNDIATVALVSLPLNTPSS